MGNIKFGILLFLSACSFIGADDYRFPAEFIFGAATGKDWMKVNENLPEFRLESLDLV